MRTDRDPQRLPWELPDALWQCMEPLIAAKKDKTGQPRTVDVKRITEEIFLTLGTGMQWQACPRERFGPPSTVSYCRPYPAIGRGGGSWKCVIHG